jgi:ornithine carbamoyltransferase
MNCFLEVDDLDPAALARVIDRAIAWKRDPAAVAQPLHGAGVAALFQKPSARTRMSVEMAVATLGGHPIYVRP